MPIIEIYRVRIDPANVERLLAIREAAVAEFRERVPELEKAELVRLDDGTWLDVITWSEPVDAERVGEAAMCTPASAEMHSLIGEEVDHFRGELVEQAWAGSR